MTALRNKTVVVPIDFSDDSVEAVRAGLARVESPEGLHVIHVLYPLDIDATLRALGPTDTVHASREAAAQDRLKEILDEAGAAGAQTALLSGDAGMETTDYARQVSADLIVVPSHGYHGLKRLLLGSTTERIIRHAHCSVLVLRRKDAD